MAAIREDFITCGGVPINFWRNSDPFKKKEHFSSSKIDRVRAFFCKSLKFWLVNLSNTEQKCLKQSHIHHKCFKISNKFTLDPFWDFPYFGFKCHLPMLQSPVCPPPSPSCMIDTPPLQVVPARAYFIDFVSLISSSRGQLGYDRVPNQQEIKF